MTGRPVMLNSGKEKKKINKGSGMLPDPVLCALLSLEGLDTRDAECGFLVHQVEIVGLANEVLHLIHSPLLCCTYYSIERTFCQYLFMLNNSF